MKRIIERTVRILALRVWLPLNGNINNQGLSNYDITTLGTISWVNGKLGAKALQAGDGTQVVNGLSINSNLTDILAEEYSISVWIKPLGNHVHYNGTILSSGDWNNTRWAFGVSQDNSKVDMLTNGYNIYVNCAIPVNEWTNLICVCDSSNRIHLYKNGEYITYITRSDKPQSDASNTTIGRETYANGYFSFNGVIQDLRLYDHALSAKEVSELAKGLVLHYRLADPYIESSKNLCTVTRSGEATDSTWGGHVTQWKFYDSTNDPVPFKEGLKAEIVYGQNGSTGGGASKYICVVTVSPSTTYTYSCYIKASDDFEYTHQNFLYIYENTASGSGVTQFGCFNKERMERIGNGWYRIWGSFTTQSTTERVSLYNYTYPSKTVNYWFGGWQIEQKDHVTPFIKPNGERDENVVWDCSGFQRNGTKYGSLSFSDDTARYRWSYYFEDYTRRIECFIDNNWIPDAITMSCWIKSTTRSARGGYHEPLNMHSTNYEISIYGSSGQARLGLVVGGTRYVSNVGPDLLDGKWHMLAITYNGSKICRYVDGELIHSEDRTGALTAVGTLGIGTLAGNTTYGSTQLYESDVRIYSTALSADDILSLYNLGGSIDSNGTFHTYEYVEV